MEEDKFQAALSRFRKVRSSDDVVFHVKRAEKPVSKTELRRSAGPTSHVDESESTVAMKDFWTGLAIILSRHYSEKDIKALTKAFDELHYSSMRSLNMEDQADLADMMARELAPIDQMTAAVVHMGTGLR